MQDRELLHGFELLQGRMDYHDCLAKLASIHLNKSIAVQMHRKNEDPLSMDRVQPQIRNAFRIEFLQRLGEMAERKSGLINSDDIGYLIQDVFHSAAATEYPNYIPLSMIFPGCFGGGERRRKK